MTDSVRWNTSMEAIYDLARDPGESTNVLAGGGATHHRDDLERFRCVFRRGSRDSNQLRRLCAADVQ